MAFLFLLAFCSPAAAKTPSRKNSVDKIALLKRAVVIVTTVDRQGKPLLQGTGFLIAVDRVVTNLHVIKDAGLIQIEMFDGRTSTIRNILAVNERDDLALLQIEAPNPDVAILQLADTAPLEGEPIHVMSNPRGSQWQLAQGRVGPIWQFKGTGKRLQISASVLPGSSGGPVLNKEGRVVGVAVMHVESPDDLNFAVPVKGLKALQTSLGAQASLPAYFR